MSEEIERIIKECSGIDTFDYVITPQQRDTMRLAEYIKELQKENQQLKEQVDNCISNEMKQQLEISNLKQENQQLKEEIKEYKRLGFKHLQEKNNKLETVLDEIREYIESKNNGICIINGEEKGAYTFLLDFDKAREFVWDLLQILDKVKE